MRWWRKNARPSASTEAGDDLVAVAWLGATEAELVAGRLRENGIDAAVFGTGTAGENAALVLSEGARVMVRRRDADAARATLDATP